MKCTFSQLRDKEIINTATGSRIGFVDDMEIDTDTGKVCSLIICGRQRLMGILGRDDDMVISCEDIKKIGTDTVLVKINEDDVVNVNKKCIINLFE